MKQFVVTPAMGKRLIGKAMVSHPAIQAALKSGTLAIVAGTTNGYVAEEILKATGQAAGFSRQGFRRGAVMPPGTNPAHAQEKLAGDVVLVNGAWQKGKEIFDYVDNMSAGDVIVKGANALDICGGRAACLIAHPMGGTVGAAIPAVIGRRVQMIIPIGLEKRVCDDLDELVACANAPDAEGPRMMILPGKTFTELDAIGMLTGAEALLLAGGGVGGAEGAVWLGICGRPEQVLAAEKLLLSLRDEPLCEA